jgi:glycine cleavage system aminomethyltransferase T
MTTQTAPALIARFDPGQVVATPAALDALHTNGQNAVHFLSRHLRADWGELDEPDKQANDHALTHRGRLLSAYTLRDGTTIWIITEADRSSTCLLLPDEY